MLGFIILIILLISAPMIFWGCYLCKENNAVGLVLLFIPLNVLGLLIGITILYNLKQKKVGK